ncbi:hypothetical protein [Actinoalloteichus hymeniacidonis]|uniref:Uncharacterized protein n=1 Tax=Actinoalloteichus hymeniacidonis TaxID=340345 RepID=A0AAC9HLE5_9PSEU|nr:hypothetical protein [Actinoalloteichus hymeniacidonis]AOS60891.1 hypothetical protein TL08_00210 [Actinoalloteichus hymeniacidonis]MBB5911109.1 hypothetical protein [Actinoalloteichus hymeniacidonis]
MRLTSQIDPLGGGDAGQVEHTAGLRSGSASSGTTEPHGGRPHWLVDCRDVANRPCVITVLVDNGKVVLLGPPGETAVLTQAEVGRLRTVLQEAAELAER